MASWLLKRVKPKEGRKGVKQTFVSYIDESQNEESEKKSEDFHSDANIKSNSNTLAGQHNTNCTRVSEALQPQWSKARATCEINISEESCTTGLPSSCTGATSESHIYAVPRRCYSESDKLETNHSTKEGVRRLTTDNVHFGHLNQSNVLEIENIYQVPEKTISVYNVHVNFKDFQHRKDDEFVECIESQNNYVHVSPQKNEDVFLNSEETEDDYIDMEVALPLSKQKHLSCSALETSRQYFEKMDVYNSKSVPTSPTARSDEKIQTSNELVYGKKSGTDIPGKTIVQPLIRKIPNSAVITPYEANNQPQPSATHANMKTREFRLYTVEEVATCFKECGLSRLGEICEEESMDGEYFQDLSDEELTQEPFSLNHFHISKVRKVIEGWRPRRLVSDPH